MQLRYHLVLSFIFSCLVILSKVYAQAGKAELTGTVRDQNRAAIAEARIVATEIATGQNYSTALHERRYSSHQACIFHRKQNLEMRLEAFNVTNTPPLGAPNAVLASPGFGSITSAGDPRVIQLGIKLNF